MKYILCKSYLNGVLKYIKIVNICKFFLFKVLYYIVYVVCYLKKNEDYKLNKIIIIFIVINIEVKKRVVCGYYFYGECILGVGVCYCKYVYCGIGSCRFWNCYSNGSFE